MTTVSTANFSITAASGWTEVATNPAYIYIQADSPHAYYLVASPTAPVTISAQATGTITFGGLPVADETFAVGATTYTFKAAAGAANTIKIGADAATTAANVSAAINAGDGAGTVYGTGTTANASAAATVNAAIVTVTARAAGTAGNSVVLTEAATNTTVSGSGTLAGGSNATVGVCINPRLVPEYQKTGATTASFYIRTTSPIAVTFNVIRDQ